MSESGENSPSMVRVQLLDGHGAALDDIEMPGRPPSDPSRIPALLALLAIIGVIGALWWLSNLDGADADSVPEDSVPEDSVPNDAAAVESATDIPQTTELPVYPDSAVAARNGRVLVAGSRAPNVESQLSQQGTTGLALGEQLSWQAFPRPFVLEFSRPGVPGTSELVGMADNGDRFVAFSTVFPDGERSGELIAYVTATGRATDDEWVERSRFDIDGFVRTVSARDGQWAAIVDRRAQSTSESAPMQTQILTGRIDGSPDETTLVELAPDEFLSSFAATDGGFYAVVIRTQLGSISDSRKPAPELRRWTQDIGWEVLEQNFSPPEGQAARIIDGGPSGIFVSWRTDLYQIDPSLPALEWPEVATGRSVTTGILSESATPQISPARTGDGFLIVDETIGNVGTIWLSTDQLWQRFELEDDVTNVSLLQIDDQGTAVLSGESNGQPVVFARNLTSRTEPADSAAADLAANTPSVEPDIEVREIIDGEWSNPVFSTATVDGPGFVRLSNVNGRISLLESANGLDIDRSTGTDLPFAYFAREMYTTSAGYHVVGLIGAFEPAVFTSTDGISWERFEIEQIGDSTALQIDHFHRSEEAAAMAGSLGWADDLQRTELVVQWWDGDGVAWNVPPRPCEEAAIRCSITSLVAVSDGVVATHQIGDKTVLSTWSTARGWRTTTDPEADLVTFPVFQNATLHSVSPDRIAVLGMPLLIESFSGGLTWDIDIDGPPGVAGGFASVSNDRTTAVFLSQDGNDAWVLSNSAWTRFSLTSIDLRSPLAIADGTALFGGSIGTQPAIVRFAPGD